MKNTGEFRIGNLVREGVMGIVPISSILSGSVWVLSNNIPTSSCHIKIANIEPIPLTPEILIACGFEDLDAEHCDALRLNPICIEFIPDGSISVRIELETNGRAYVINYREYYLHQLQNLYWCLCGKELQIKDLNIAIEHSK